MSEQGKEEKAKEGWTPFMNSRKWHYVRDRMTLCRKFAYFGPGNFVQGGDDSPDNCADCKRKVEKEKGA